jgi:hypothetical protein
VRTASEILGDLDDAEEIIRIAEGLTADSGASPLRAQEDFERAFRALVVNRIVEANAKNEYSRKLDLPARDVRGLSKQLFERMIAYADSRTDPAARKDLYLLLCYLKPESPSFAARVSELRWVAPQSPDPVAPDFVRYVDCLSTGTGASIPQLTFAGHFANTTTLTIAGEVVQCRVALSPSSRSGRVYFGCSSADSVLFDPESLDYEMFVTIPGLSLRHLNGAFLVAAYSSLIAPARVSDDLPIQITVCVGFVDQLKIAGALNEWQSGALESVVDNAVHDAIAGVSEANRHGGNRFEFAVYPGCFPGRLVNRTTVNGVAPFHPSNARFGDIIGKRLRQVATSTDQFPFWGLALPDASLIHDREIHPKLGLRVRTLACSTLFHFQSQLFV